ncbi:hypothetical protein TNIN_206741 [Trichonephila inaurata madagascariensis]|uniref:Uncharacterized protein n=1 Tax=Trichonephila inaurata madagascariensis TaxID=2747483 RepID=A0A8X7BPL8_9ARAC|nr:hypothetical protein TNIN_206741 [Trichonephila inaurata madagascariensis]
MSSLCQNTVYCHSKAEGESKLLGLPTRSKVVKKFTLATKSFIHRNKSTRLKQSSTIQFNETIRQQIRLDPNTREILQEPVKGSFLPENTEIRTSSRTLLQKRTSNKKNPKNQRKKTIDSFLK